MGMYEEILAESDLVSLIARQLREDPARVAYRFVRFAGDDIVSDPVRLGDIDRLARRLAITLQDRGLRPGDAVIVLGSQTLEDVVAVVGCLSARVTCCVLPPPVDAPQTERLRSALASSRAKLVALSPGLFGPFGDKLKTLAPEHDVQLLSIDADLAQGPDDRETDWRPPPLVQDAPALFHYTSGSTSAPKPIVLSHRNVIHNLACYRSPPTDDMARTFGIWVPFFHSIGLMCLLMPLVDAVSLVVMTPRDFMANPVRWFQLIDRFRVEGTFGPHSAYAMCSRLFSAESVRGLDLSSLRIAMNGAEPIDLASLRAFCDKFRPAGLRDDVFLPCYGIGECTSVVARADRLASVVVDGAQMQQNRFLVVAPDHPRARTLVSVGRPVLDTKVAIVDPQARTPCAPGEIGEIWVQSASVAQGYLGDAAATEETFAARLIGTEGRWLRTGDLGSVVDGELFVTGRIKELIIVHGRNYYPQDIEQTLRKSVPEVRDSRMVIFSRLDERGAECVVCCLESSPALRADLEALAGEITSAIVRDYGFAPHEVVVVKESSLPRTANGKLQAVAVRALHRDGRLSIVASVSARQRAGTPASESAAWTEVQRQVHDLFGEALGRQPGGLDEDFFLLGGTSLGIALLTSRVNEQMGVQLAMRAVLERPTVNHLSLLVESFRSGVRLATGGTPPDELRRDCALASEITPTAGARAQTGPGSLFVTGATGFLGAYLVRELLEKTDARIFCHVRADGPDQAVARLRDNLRFYELWNDSFSARLVAVPGDLTRPAMGLSPSSFRELADSVDAVYHSGALVNFIYPYRMLKGTNVKGTEEALRFAVTGRPKRFHHVSTFSVYDNPSFFGRKISEDDQLSDPAGYLLGYSESKWVAEQMVRTAFSRGLRGSIFRPGEITGSSATGIWRVNDTVIRSLLASLVAGVLPASQMRFHITPVDYVAGAIVRIAAQEPESGQAFNLINLQVKSLSELAPILDELGYPMEVVPLEVWTRRVLADPNGYLKPLESLLKENMTGDASMELRYGQSQALFSCDNAERRLRGSGIHPPPPLDAALMATYLRYFRKVGYIGAPDRMTRQEVH